MQGSLDEAIKCPGLDHPPFGTGNQGTLGLGR